MPATKPQIPPLNPFFCCNCQLNCTSKIWLLILLEQKSVIIFLQNHMLRNKRLKHDPTMRMLQYIDSKNNSRSNTRYASPLSMQKKMLIKSKLSWTAAYWRWWRPELVPEWPYPKPGMPIYPPPSLLGIHQYCVPLYHLKHPGCF